MNESRVDALVERIAKLEQQNGRLKWFGSASFLVTLTLIGISAVRNEARPDRAENVIRAEDFIVVDAQGRSLIGIGSNIGEKGRGAIQFLDKSGKRRMTLSLDSNDTPIVRLTGREGQDELALEMRPGAGVGISIRDKKRNSGLLLGTSPEGVAALGFMGEDGKPVLQMGVNPDGSSLLILRDKDGKEHRLPQP